MLVDSCIEPAEKSPATLHYLKSIGVAPADVKWIVASHWHDDHVRGFADLAAECSSAEVFIPGVFSDNEARQMLAAYSGSACLDLSRGTKELFRVVSERTWIPVSHRIPIFEVQNGGVRAQACALTPLPAATHRFVAHAAQYLPQLEGPINDAPELRPNGESIAIHVDLGDEAVLLGSDLEEHNEHGWSAVAENIWCCGRRKCSIYKVAHHGSEGAHHPTIFERLLQDKPLSVMTPFNSGRVKLPTDADKKRITALSRAGFITSRSTAKSDLPPDQLKRLNKICKGSSKLVAGFGAISLRRPIAGGEWNIRLFGDAAEL